MGAHARTVVPNAGQHDYQTFFGGIERDDVQSGAQPSIEVLRINGADVGANLPWRRYAELRGLSVEDERAVEETTQILTHLLVKINGTVSRVPGLTARLHGIRVHTAFAIAVKALRLPPHLGTLTLQVEQSFDQLGPTRYGQPGSIRTDVILRNAKGAIIAIYDVKTGDAEMRPSTESKYRGYTKVNPSIQLIILRARRGQR